MKQGWSLFFALLALLFLLGGGLLREQAWRARVRPVVPAVVSPTVDRHGQ